MRATTIFSGSNIETHHIVEAAALLKEGALVAFPTETVYGLGGNALSDSAVACIYETKGRPQFNPLIVHVPSLADAEQYADVNAVARTIAKTFWPGPLTLVLPRRQDCRLSLLVSAGLDTVAIRVPAHPVAQALLNEASLPIAAPSANKSGYISPTSAAHVREGLGQNIMVLDGGECPVGIESTVVDATGKTPVILRPGFVTQEQLAVVASEVHTAAANARITAPGMLERHYAPVKSLRLNATSVKKDEALLAFGGGIPTGARTVENLSAAGDLREAAANLFRMLRALDGSDAAAIAVMPIPEKGLGVAINDRLTRAAAR